MSRLVSLHVFACMQKLTLCTSREQTIGLIYALHCWIGTLECKENACLCKSWTCTLLCMYVHSEYVRLYVWFRDLIGTNTLMKVSGLCVCIYNVSEHTCMCPYAYSYMFIRTFPVIYIYIYNTHKNINMNIQIQTSIQTHARAHTNTSVAEGCRISWALQRNGLLAIRRRTQAFRSAKQHQSNPFWRQHFEIPVTAVRQRISLNGRLCVKIAK